MGCKTPNIRIAEYRANGTSVTKQFIPHWKIKSYENYREANEIYQNLHKQDPKGYRDLRVQIIPCGTCTACQMNKARQWAMRCMAEAQYHEKNWFVTLTYDNEHLPHIYGDEYNDSGTLQLRDMQLFLKRLRKHLYKEYGVTGMKFFYCGEYGPRTKRPHYHAILFNCPLDESQFKVIAPNLYTSKELEDKWGNGIVSIGEVTAETAAYVARYTTKKHYGTGAKQCYTDMEIKPEYICMSRREGIGLQYYNDHKDEIYKTDEMLYNGKYQKFKVKPVKYYDRKYDLEQPEEMEAIKAERQRAAEQALKTKMAQTTLTEKEQLKNELEILEENLKKGEGYKRAKLEKLYN